MSASDQFTLQYADARNSERDDRGVMPQLALFAVIYETFRAVSIVEYRLLVDRTWVYEEVVSPLDYFHGLVWPPVIAGLMAAALFTFAIGGWKTYRKGFRGHAIFRMGAWGVIAAFTLNLAEELGTGFAANSGFISLSAGSKLYSDFGVAGVFSWRFEECIRDVALPVAGLAMTSSRRSVITVADVIRSARWMYAVALAVGIALIVEELLEKNSDLRLFLIGIHASEPNWPLFRGSKILLDIILVVSAALFLAGSIPAILLKNWGRRMVLAGAWLTVFAVVLYTSMPFVVMACRAVGLVAAVPYPLWPDIIMALLHQVDFRAPHGILALTLVIVLSRRSLAAACR